MKNKTKSRSLKKWINFTIVVICFPIIFSAFISGNANPDQTVKHSLQVAIVSANISIVHMAFFPASITVVKGTKVIWTDNQWLMPHTVTSDIKGLFESGNLHKNDTFSYTFNNAGTYSYFCRHHNKMHGEVIVK